MMERIKTQSTISWPFYLTHFLRQEHLMIGLILWTFESSVFMKNNCKFNANAWWRETIKERVIIWANDTLINIKLLPQILISKLVVCGTAVPGFITGCYLIRQFKTGIKLFPSPPSYLFICLFIYLFICLFIYLFIYLFAVFFNFLTFPLTCAKLQLHLEIYKTLEKLESCKIHRI